MQNVTAQLRDRLMPSLLDRLTDAAPAQRSESADARTLTHSQLRASVLRNLSCLFNAVRLDDGVALASYPHVRRSVLNYGLPPLAGRVVSGLKLHEVERELRQAILHFEPRLIADTVHVTAITDGKDMHHHNSVVFRIDACLWAQPAPVELCLHTALDLESGQCTVAENGRRRP